MSSRHCFLGLDSVQLKIGFRAIMQRVSGEVRRGRHVELYIAVIWT